MLNCCKRKYEVYGPQGGISTKLTLPANAGKKKLNLVILMHGFIAGKNRKPVSSLAGTLAVNGYAVLSFDFNAHGKSEGRFVDMTVSSEIADAKAVFEYACGLPFVNEVAFVGHSQGGVIAGMLSGQLERGARKPKCLVQLAPAAVLKDDALAGKCMMSKYDPVNPPEYVNVMFHKLGRKFILEAQKLPIYETSTVYSGPVCIVHGTADKIVPVSYSERYADGYKNCTSYYIEGANHFFGKKAKEMEEIVLNFLKENL